jgi:hypothetical protein
LVDDAALLVVTLSFVVGSFVGYYRPMWSALRFMFVAIDATGNVIETQNPARDFKEW